MNFQFTSQQIQGFLNVIYIIFVVDFHRNPGIRQDLDEGLETSPMHQKMFCLDGVALKAGKLFSLVEILVFIPANGLKMVHPKI